MLNDTEKSVIKLIADNSLLFEAVKKVLKEKFSLENIKLGDNTFEELGEITATRLAGLELVEAGFTEIAKHKSVEPKRVLPNKAR